MIFCIAHTVTYQYSSPVFLEPHLLRVRPRYDGIQRVKDFQIHLEPTPAGTSDYLDAEGNVTTNVWFNGLTDRLMVAIKCEVETLRSNPFDFLQTPDLRSNGQLAVYLQRSAADESVNRFAQEITARTKGERVQFLSALGGAIHGICQTEIRDTGEPHTAAVTLASRLGSCRDLAVLFVEACRSQGVPARFVSGYQAGESDDGQYHLHAWAEAFVPGGGWRGFDPSLGLAVGDRYVTVAAAAASADAAPITGTFRGTGATAQMTAQLDVKAEVQRRGVLIATDYLDD